MTSLRAVAALCVAVLLTACGGDSSSEKEMNLEGFVSSYASTMCNALAACSCTDASALADCKTVYREYMSLSAAEMFMAYPGARIEPAAAKTCLDDLKAALATCPSPSGGADMAGAVPPLAIASTPAVKESGPVMFLDIPSCDQERIIVGVQTEGEHCADAVECAAGLVCDYSTMSCVTAPVADALCDLTDGDCAAGLYCSGTDGYTCVPIPAVGAECDANDRVCAEGSRCVSVEGTYRCVAPHAVGASCEDGAGCAAGLYCDGTCQALRADGAECDYGNQCEHDWCNDEGECADPGFCALVSPVR